MMRACVLGVALLACACAPQSNGGALPAPTPDEVSLRITEAQNGERIEAVIGERFAVELIGVPTAGYEWTPAQLPPFLTRAGEATGDTIREQSERGYAGGNHWEVLMFVATEAGEGELVLEQRRPWETEQPAADVFRVTIAAR